MELGWAESAPRLRSRLPNLNLLPAELLPTPLPWLTAGLVLLSLGLLMLLYALFYMKSYADLETAALRSRLAEGQAALRAYGLPVDAVGPDGQLLLPPGTVEDWAELRARQVDWSAVFAVVANSLTPAIQLSGLSQAGYTVSIAGDAASAQDANTFLQKLRDSGLFTSLEMTITAQQPEAPPAATPVAPPAAATAIPPPTQPPPPPPTQPPPPPPTVPPPVPRPGGNSGGPPVAPPTAPPPAVAPPAPTSTLAPRTPLATPSPVGTPPTVGPTATPTPQYDFIVQSKRETVDPAAIGNNSAVRVRVIDAGGQLVPGLRVHIDSQGDPPWSSELPRPGDNPSNGTFEFPVGMGKFTVWVMNGSSERAIDLFTGVQGQPGVHVWDVTFRKTISGTPAAQPVCNGCTPTPIPSPTNTVAPTATPVSVGSNLSNLACVTASDRVLPDHGPEKAVDGDVNTYWDAGHGPIQQITLDFTRFPNNHPRACQLKPIGGAIVLDPSNPNQNVEQFNSVMLEAIEMVPLMTGASKVTHEVWTIYDSDATQLEYTFADVDASDNVTLSARFAAVRTIKQLRIRTIRSGVNVEWREIRLFQPLPPAFGSWTATPTPTPTFGASPTGTPTPLAQATIAIGSLQASSENPGNPAAFAADGSSLTFWRPVANQSPAFLQANFASAQSVQGVRFLTAMGDAIATQTATVGPSTPTPTPFGATYRVVLLRPSLAAAGAAATPTPAATATPARTVGGAVRAALGLDTPTPAAGAPPSGPTRAAQDVDCNFQFVAQDNATVQLICSETSGVTGVRIYVDSPGNPALPPGIRELVIYPPLATATPTPTATLTQAAVASAPGTATPTATVTLTQTVVASATGTATPPATATSTRTATATSTRTATVTPTTVAVASSGGMLAALVSVFEPARASAAPLDQAQPKPTPSQATLPPAVQTTIAQAQRPPPTQPPAAVPTPAVVGAPQAVATALPGPGPLPPAAVPAGQPPVAGPPAQPAVESPPTQPPVGGPSALPPVVNTVPPPAGAPNRPPAGAQAPAGGAQPGAAAQALPAGTQPAVVAQAGSRGRVSFVIVAQVRPGAP